MTDNEGSTTQVKEYTPKTGLIYHRETSQLILCKPKLMPLKSLTLQKLEKMQNDANKVIKQQFELSKN